MIQPIRQQTVQININLQGADDLKGLLMQFLTRATFPEQISEVQISSTQPGGPDQAADERRDGVRSLAGSRYSADSQTMVQAYQQLCVPRDELRGLKGSSRGECQRAIQQFEAWLVSDLRNSRSVTPVTTVQSEDVWQVIDSDPMVLRRFRQAQISEGLAERTAMKKITTVKKLLRCCVEVGRLSRMPESPECYQEQSDLSETVTVEEMRKIRAVCDRATWPKIPGDLIAADYWRFAVDMCWTYGPRLLDFASYKAEKTGLLWSHVTLKPECPAPQLKGFQHQHGWVWFPIGKASRKKRMLLLPLSQRIREHFDRWHARAVSLEEASPTCRVVPLTFGRMHNAQWRRLLTTAEVDQRIRLSEGRGIPSFRKGCAVHWETISGELADYVLGHRGKSMRSRHYGQAVRLVAEAIERVPF